METVTIRDVEILAPGTWNGADFSDSDLAGIVAAYEETKDIRPPRTQLGHDLKQRIARALFGHEVELSGGVDGVNGFPKLGRPSNVRMKAGRMLCDFVNLPAKVWEAIQADLYSERSVGLKPNVTVGGKTYRWLLDHVAFLGDEPPAVEGLAPMLGLSGVDADVVCLARGVDAAGAPIALAQIQVAGTTLTADQVEAALAGVVDDIRRLEAKAGELTRRLPGNPVLTNLFRALREGIDRVVRTNLSGADMPPTDATLADPGLPGDPAVPAGTAPVAAAPSTPTISKADTLVAMLAAKLDLRPDAFDDIWAAFNAAIAAASPEAEGEGDEPSLADGPATTEGSATMSDATPPTPPADLTLAEQVNQLKADHAALQVALKASEDAAKRARAEQRVDADIMAHGLPETVRDVLLTFAEAGQDAHYETVIASAQKVPTSERGSSGAGDVALSGNTLSAHERKVAKALSLSDEQYLAQKQADRAEQAAG